MTEVHSCGLFWSRAFKVHGTWKPIWFGRTTQTEGKYRSSIHPVVQWRPGHAVAFGIFGRSHTEHDGLLLAMRSFGKTNVPRSEVINPDEDGVGKARVTEDIDLFTGKRFARRNSEVIDLTTHEGTQRALKLNLESWMTKCKPVEKQDEEM